MNGQQLKNSILQMAVQGKLVPQDPNDEPASVLIQRIREEKEKLIKEKKIKKEKNPSYIFRGSDNLHYEKIGNADPVCIEEQMPFEIPDSWEWVRFSNVVNLTSGQDMTPDKYNSLEKGIPYITGASNIENGRIIINRWTESPKALAHFGDLLITCKGTVGAIAILNIEEVHIARQLMAITPIGDVNPKYIQIFLQSYVETLISSSKSMIPGISRDDVLWIQFPVPPLEEQKRIIGKIEELLPHINEYDAKASELIELNDSFPERFKKSILQEAVQGKLVPQDPNDEPASILLEKIAKEKEKLIKEGKIKKQKSLPPITEDEIPFDIPNTWVRAILRDVCFLSDGEKISGTTLPYLDAKYLRGKKNVEFRDNGKLIFKGEYAILVDGENSGEVFSIPEDGIMGSTFKKLIITPFMEAKFILYFLEYYRSFFRNNKKGAAIPHLNKELFAYTPIGIPPLEEQKRIVAKIEELMPLIEEFSKA
ncbi:MAG: restriction endonuclease subunit S [Succinivibrionaceae bacterium]|nr:restriction endonuclease subunit S [Succinivibrionaceae bacterium]